MFNEKDTAALRKIFKSLEKVPSGTLLIDPGKTKEDPFLICKSTPESVAAQCESVQKEVRATPDFAGAFMVVFIPLN